MPEGLLRARRQQEIMALRGIIGDREHGVRAVRPQSIALAQMDGFFLIEGSSIRDDLPHVIAVKSNEVRDLLPLRIANREGRSAAHREGDAASWFDAFHSLSSLGSRKGHSQSSPTIRPLYCRASLLSP